ncbi:YphA family membrane protein [Bacillus benzoevorans]|uniref:Magnesium-transporting ATPase (P-type) n=1 Tax=Bacillus benzoevorans TaxID=1456 RepID=A0A7X0HQ29_9BACI|nr:hypothetical protein [Bacillus benzoevorans]MBB6444714.1 magnesium-transporting ATPase (P-type) [Bacillus benzoevorans]
MDGLLFYWIFWLGWVITTFFYRRDHPHRLTVSAWILGAVILASVTFNILGLQWNGAGLFFIVTVYLYIAGLQSKQALYFLLSSFILMVLTVSFLLFELFDPVWIIIERKWLLAVLVVYGTLLLHSDKNKRILSLLFGMVHGEIFYAYILKKFTFSYPISSPAFLDALALACVLVLTWNSLELITAFFNKYFQSVEKGKQKYHE